MKSIRETIRKDLRVRLVCKTASTIQNSTRKNSTMQGRTTQNKFLCHWIIFCFIWFLGDEMLFWYFKQPVRGTKKLYYGLVRDKNISFCLVPCIWLVQHLKQFYKSNTGQLKLFCFVLHFLANQTHPRGQWVGLEYGLW